LRERLGALSDSTAWLAIEPTRRHLIDRIGELFKRLA
jgi:hypothetical protein